MKFIKDLIRIEKKYFKYFYKSSFDLRESFTGNLLDQKFKNLNKILKKSLANKLQIFFLYNSKISRDFLLNPIKHPKYIWEPQTTKLILEIANFSKNVIFAGSFFGDQAILASKKNPKSIIHCFEPNLNQIRCLKLNKKTNKLDNIIINRKILFSKNDLNFNMIFPKAYNYKVDEGSITAKKSYLNNKDSIKSVTLDRYCLFKNIKKIDLLHMDVEGNEYQILKGAKKLLNNNCIENIIFELNSNYFNWNKGLLKLDLIKYLLKLDYMIFAIRDLHSSFELKTQQIELLPLRNIYLKGPKHGFNMIATKNLKIAKYKNNFSSKLSPKYLPYKTEKYFHSKSLIDMYK